MIEIERPTPAAASREKPTAQGPEPCFSCKGTGVILARHRTDQSNYAFQCDCVIARQKGRPYPVWGPRWMDDYETGAA